MLQKYSIYIVNILYFTKIELNCFYIYIFSGEITEGVIIR